MLAGAFGNGRREHPGLFNRLEGTPLMAREHLDQGARERFVPDFNHGGVAPQAL
ncbi:hypothetical protein Thiowin_04154 [Thiorhodovibrio winogradskyi]|uniref:Uncharacterized protein n=2 Tax=Thiorhodovibrio winogradskyi TaxID=77007 RepID=A0ABZ0SF96_9GAMM